MAEKIRRIANAEGVYLVFCPGCRYCHHFDSRWTFNGDMERPTFSPSLLVFSNDPDLRCHSYLKDGKWEFLSDSFHALAGKTVDMEPLPGDK